MDRWHITPFHDNGALSRISFFLGLISGASLGALGTALYYQAALRRRPTPRPTPRPTRDGKAGGDGCEEGALDVLGEINRKLDELRKIIEEGRRVKRSGSGYITADSSLPGSDTEEKFEDVNESESDTDIYFHATETPSLRKRKKPGVLASALSSAPEDLISLSAEVDRLLDGGEDSRKEAHDILMAKFHMHQHEAAYIWRLSRATFLLSQIRGGEGDSEGKRELAFRARELAFQALELDRSDGDVRKWCAITIGNLGDYVSIAEKIKNGLVFKEHIMEAIRLMPANPSCHYLLGRWYFGVYMITWMERKVASTLVSNVPSATVDEALGEFLVAEQLKPNQWKDNMLHIAKCYIEKHEYAEAVSWLRRAEPLPILDGDDQIAHNQLMSLLKAYSSY